MDLCPVEAVPVAVECVDDSTPLQDFSHPERAFYIFGPEKGSLADAVIERCAATVRIPSVRCLNLAAAVYVTLYDREAKSLRK